MLANLVQNASKFVPEQTEIAIRATKNGNYIKFMLSDQVPGIPHEQRESVFEAFRQIETNAKSSQGVELGLAIARGIVQAHKGQIWVEETNASGTAIAFTLPLVSDDWRDRS